MVEAGGRDGILVGGVVMRSTKRWVDKNKGASTGRSGRGGVGAILDEFNTKHP